MFFFPQSTADAWCLLSLPQYIQSSWARGFPEPQWGHRCQQRDTQPWHHTWPSGRGNGISHCKHQQGLLSFCSSVSRVHALHWRPPVLVPVSLQGLSKEQRKYNQSRETLGAKILFFPTKLPQENTTEEQTEAQPVCKCMWMPTRPRQHLQLPCPSSPTWHSKAGQSHMAVSPAGICQPVCQMGRLKHSDVMGSHSVAGRKPSARHQSVPIKARDTECIAPGRAVLHDLD